MDVGEFIDSEKSCTLNCSGKIQRFTPVKRHCIASSSKYAV
jgi:hypothetical protein